MTSPLMRVEGYRAWGLLEVLGSQVKPKVELRGSIMALSNTGGATREGGRVSEFRVWDLGFRVWGLGFRV